MNKLTLNFLTMAFCVTCFAQQREVNLAMPVGFPEFGEIEAIVAEVHQVMLGGSDIQGFMLPPAYHETVLRYFEHGKKDSDPNPRYTEVGSLRVVLNSKKMVRLAWYHTGGDRPLMFSFQGIRYAKTFEHKLSADEALALDAWIRRAYSEVTGEKRSQFGTSKGFEISPYRFTK